MVAYITASMLPPNAYCTSKAPVSYRIENVLNSDNYDSQCESPAPVKLVSKLALSKVWFQHDLVLGLKNLCFQGKCNG